MADLAPIQVLHLFVRFVGRRQVRQGQAACSRHRRAVFRVVGVEDCPEEFIGIRGQGAMEVQLLIGFQLGDPVA